MKLCGIWNQPFINLEPWLDLSGIELLDDEICLGLTRAELSYTGGSLKWMGVVAPHIEKDPYVDYMNVIEQFSFEEWQRLVSLCEDPSEFDHSRWREYRFGDETDNPLNARQMLWLKYRYGVYFPWKVAFHFVENNRWEDKNSGAEKGYNPQAELLFPRTTAFLKKLPFKEIGRALIFGIEANDHAPLHRDTEPTTERECQHCITICPRQNKRLYLMDDSFRSRTYVKPKAYWFNDMDWHGVDVDPYFRYSIRIDGVFEDSFYERLRNHFNPQK